MAMMIAFATAPSTFMPTKAAKTWLLIVTRCALFASRSAGSCLFGVLFPRLTPLQFGSALLFGFFGLLFLERLDI